MLIPFGSYRFLLYPTIHLNTKAVLLSKGQLSCRRLSPCMSLFKPVDDSTMCE